jgi:CCR4-NOT complex subunit CAF16
MRARVRRVYCRRTVPTDAPTPAAAIEVDGLTFRYPGAPAPVFADLSLAVPAGARCLLLGANGVGKSTLLRLVAGRHMLAPDLIRVLGRPAFHDTALAGDVAFLGGPFPFSADISVADVLAARPGIDPARRARVLEILEIDPGWRMHQVSDGQRRRVQLLLDLERRLRVILLDEVTAELDVLSRADLLRFLRAESERAGLTVVYASHVLEGLGAWATHVAFLSPGRLRLFAPIADVPELRDSSLAALCERWMREDRLQDRLKDRLQDRLQDRPPRPSRPSP